MLFKITVLLAFHNQLCLRKRDFIFYWSGKQLFIKWWRRALQGVHCTVHPDVWCRAHFHILKKSE